ncbi:MAG: MJ0042-type zinc finger domain-containing protein [Tepidisphaeraceae bacterium]|jgi:predicted Zn finger-like uncharacterized protein
MPIRVTCQGCAAQYTVGEHMAGKRVKCKRCGSMFEIPRTGEPAQPHIEDVIAKDAPAVGFKDDGDRLFKEPAPQALLPAENTGQALDAVRYDELDVAASTKPQKVEDAGSNAVGRPDADATPTGRKRLLKLKPGAKSFSDKAKMGEVAAARQAQKEKAELLERIEMRTVFSDFRKNPLSKLVMGIGIGAFVLYHLWMALHYSDWLVLRNMGIRMAAYAILSIPLGMLGVYLTALVGRFKPTQPLAFVVGVTAAAPPGILVIGFLTEDDTYRLAAALAAIPVTFWIFHLAFQQGIVRNLAAFFGMCTLPLLVAWAGYANEDLRKLREEYLSDAPPAAVARAAEKARQARPAIPDAVPQQPNLQ